MSSNIDTRIVEMQFENGKFERDIAKTISSLEKLDNSLSLNNIVKSVGTAASVMNGFKLDGLKDTLEGIGEKLQKSESAIWRWFESLEAKALSAAANIAKSFTIQPAVDGWEEYNTKTKSTQTLLNNVSKFGSTMDDVSAVLDELNEYADKTTYSFAGMIQTMSGASASGLNLDQLKDYTVGLSNLAAYSGVDNTQLQRAGYQINQALSAGVFQMQDWRSIENANLATVGFMDTLKDVAREGGIAIDQIIDDAGSFRNSLSTKNGPSWLTSDIFLEALNRYGDSTTELGKKAFESATKTKTFAESMDQIKESLGSGWGKSFEIIVGNMEQAKEFWTTITNGVLKFTDSLSDSRNEMLKTWREQGGAENLLKILSMSIATLRIALQQLGKGWNQIFPALTGERLAEITDQVRDFIANIYIFVSSSTEFIKIGKGVASLLQGALTVLHGLGIAISPVVGWIWEGIKALVNLILQWSEWQATAGSVKIWGEAFIKSAEDVRDAIASIPDKIKWVIGQIKLFYWILKRTLLLKGIPIDSIFSNIKTGLNEIFGAFIEFFTGPFKKDGEETVGIFEALQKIFSSKNMLNGAMKLGEAIANIFGFFTSIKTWFEGSKLKGIFDSIGGFFSDLWAKLFPKKETGGPDEEKKSLLMRTLETFKTGFEHVYNWMVTTFKPAFDDTATFFTNIWNGIASFFGGIWDKIVEIFTTAWNLISPILQNLYQTFKPLIDIVKNMFGDLKNFFNEKTTGDTLVNAGFLGTLVAAISIISKHLKSLDKAVSEFNFLKTFKLFDKDGPLFWLRNMLENLTNSQIQKNKEAVKLMKSKVLDAIATALLKLAAALLIISLVDSEKAGKAAIIMITLVGDLLFSMQTIADMKGLNDIAEVAALSKTLSKLATTMIEMSVALKIMGSVKQLGGATIAMISLMGSLVGALSIFSTFKPNEVGTIDTIMPAVKKMAGAIIKMATALKIVSMVPSDNVLQASLGMIGIIAALAAFATSIGKTLDERQALIVAQVTPVITKIATAVLMLTAGVLLLGKMDSEQLGRGLLGVIVLMGSMVLLIETMIKNKSAITSLSGIGEMMLLMSISVIGMAASVLMLSTLPAEQMFKAVLAVVILMDVMSLMAKEVASTGDGATMLAAGAGMLLVGVALIAIAQAIKMIADIDYVKMSASVAVMAGIFGIMALMILLTSAVPPAGLILLGAAMIVLSIGLTGVVAIMQVLAQMDPGKMTQAIIGFAAIMLAIGGIMALMGSLGPVIIVGAAAFAIFAVAVLALAGAFALLAAAFASIAVTGTAALPILGALISGVLVAAIAGFIKGLEVLLKGIQLLLPVILETLDVILYSIRDWLFDKVTFFVENVIKYVIAILDGIIPNIAEIIVKLFELIKEILKGVSTGLDENGDEIAIYISDIVYKLIDMIIKALINLFSKLINLGYDLGTQIGDGLVKAWPWIKDNIIKPIEDGWNAIKGWFSSFLQAGKDLLDNIVNGILEAPDKIKDTISGFINNAVDWIKNFDFLQVGRDIIGGLLQGIGLNADDFFDAAGNLAEGAVDMFKTIFDINSPSRVMKEDIAENGIIAGLIEGMKNGMSSVNSQAEDSSKGILDIFGSNLSLDNFENMFGDDLNPTITPVLDLSNVESGLGDLNGMMPTTSIDLASMTGHSFNAKKNADYSAALNNEAKMDELLNSMNQRDSSFAEALMKNNDKDIKVYLDKDILVGQMYRGIDSKLGREATIQRRQ